MVRLVPNLTVVSVKLLNRYQNTRTLRDTNPAPHTPTELTRVPHARDPLHTTLISESIVLAGYHFVHMACRAPNPLTERSA